MADELAAGAPGLMTYDEAMTRLRSLPVEQRMTALGFVAVAERGHVSEDSGWWYGDDQHPLGGSVMDHQVLWTEAK